MSWVSLSGIEVADSGGQNSYKEVAKQAFASPTNLGSRLGNRTQSKDGLNLSSSGSLSSRRTPSRINSKEDAETFQQMFDSTAVQVPKNQPPKEKKSSNLGEGLKSLANRVSRQYHADISSTEADLSGNGSYSISKESFSLGSVSRRTKDLDLSHNDNSFHVIGGLIVEFFQSKQKNGNSDLRLTAQDIAQLDRLAPPRVRASFVEAVRYRFTNAPMDSTNSVHMLARQCHDLGLDAEGPNNPLLVAAEAEIIIPVPPRGSHMSATSSRASSSGDQQRESRSATSSLASSSGEQHRESKISTPSRTSASGEPQRESKSATSSRASASGASSGASDSDHFESIPQSGSTPSFPSASPPSENPANNIPETQMASIQVPISGRPPRQNGDPPAGRGESSVSSRLTKMGVEVQYGSENGSNASFAHYSAASANRSESSAVKGRHAENNNHASVSTSLQGSVISSLTRFGIEMPRYEDGVSSVGGGVSVLSDVKSMTTSLTRLGVEMPLKDESGYASSAQSESGVSHSSGHRSHGSGSGTSGSQSRSMREPVVVETVTDPAVLSMSRTDDESSILPVGSSKEFGNGENLAKQQLTAELREAQHLMAESKTMEAAKFWRDHVLELEARLRALDGEEGSVAADKTSKLVSNGGDAPHHATHSESRSMGGTEENGGNHLYVRHSIKDYHSNGSNASGMRDPIGVIAMNMGGGMRPTNFDPSLEGVPMVDVVAPADLPGGYHFEAEIEGRRFLATVPAGGVQKGETFSCYMRDLEKVGSDIPVGRWRDGLFDCCSIGCCHPVICNSLFCPLVLLGQIMTRVGFDFLGRPSLDNSINGPGTLWTIISFWAFVNVVLFCAYNVKWSRGMELSMADLGALAFVNVSYTLFVVYVTSATRGSLREKYYIRESRFHDLEDCCCATFCLPCSVCQMARHTADYDEYEGVCCNDTGLPDVYESNKMDAASSSSSQKQSYNIV